MIMDYQNAQPLFVDELSRLLLRLLGPTTIAELSPDLPMLRFVHQFTERTIRTGSHGQDTLSLLVSDGIIIISRGGYLVMRHQRDA